MIVLSDELFEFMVNPQLGDKLDNTLETVHQTKIVEFLDGLGFDTIKIIVANKAGGSDIIATSLIGQTWRIEVKKASETGARKLQLIKLRKSHNNNKAVCMVAYGFKDFKLKYNKLVSSV